MGNSIIAFHLNETQFEIESCFSLQDDKLCQEVSIWKISQFQIKPQLNFVRKLLFKKPDKIIPKLEKDWVNYSIESIVVHCGFHYISKVDRVWVNNFLVLSIRLSICNWRILRIIKDWSVHAHLVLHVCVNVRLL